MMGAPAGGQEDMFAKLESMRAVITEVNAQFKDPVSCRTTSGLNRIVYYSFPVFYAGKDDVCVRVYLRVLVALRDGAVGAGVDEL
jgi:hypothetical protein